MNVSSQGMRLQAAAAHVIGTAAANNPNFQKALLGNHPDVFAALLAIAASSQEDASAKGVYAVASLVRNAPEVRAAFTAAGGLAALEGLMTSATAAARTKRKVRGEV